MWGRSDNSNTVFIRQFHKWEVEENESHFPMSLVFLILYPFSNWFKGKSILYFLCIAIRGVMWIFGILVQWRGLHIKNKRITIQYKHEYLWIEKLQITLLKFIGN